MFGPRSPVSTKMHIEDVVMCSSGTYVRGPCCLFPKHQSILTKMLAGDQVEEPAPRSGRRACRGGRHGGSSHGES